MPEKVAELTLEEATKKIKDLETELKATQDSYQDMVKKYNNLLDLYNILFTHAINK